MLAPFTHFAHSSICPVRSPPDAAFELGRLACVHRVLSSCIPSDPTTIDCSLLIVVAISDPWAVQPSDTRGLARSKVIGVRLSHYTRIIKCLIETTLSLAVEPSSGAWRL